MTTFPTMINRRQRYYFEESLYCSSRAPQSDVLVPPREEVRKYWMRAMWLFHQVLRLSRKFSSYFSALFIRKRHLAYAAPVNSTQRFLFFECGIFVDAQPLVSTSISKIALSFSVSGQAEYTHAKMQCTVSFMLRSQMQKWSHGTRPGATSIKTSVYLPYATNLQVHSTESPTG